MTPDEQRIAIAEAVGWKPLDKKTFNGHQMWQRDGVIAALRCAIIDGIEWLPDYARSLDALRDAEKRLTPDQAELYNQELCDMELACAPSECPASNYVYHLSAEQKAVAFLRTLCLWQPQPAR